MAVDTTPKQQGLERYVRDALRAVDLKVSDLTDEQRQRAQTAPEVKGGLRGKQLGIWISEAETPRQTVEHAHEEQRQAEQAERVRQHITKSKDPEAAALAVAAKGFAGVKSPFSPSEGRVFLNEFAISPGVAGMITVTHGEVAENLSLEQVQAFAKGHVLDSADSKKVIRAAMVALGNGTVLWGRKLAALISVQAMG